VVVLRTSADTDFVADPQGFRFGIREEQFAGELDGLQTLLKSRSAPSRDPRLLRGQTSG